MQKLGVFQETAETEEGTQLVDVGFRVTLIVDRDNNLQVIDSTKHDWHDFVDCETIAVKEVIIRV